MLVAVAGNVGPKLEQLPLLLLQTCLNVKLSLHVFKVHPCVMQSQHLLTKSRLLILPQNGLPRRMWTCSRFRN